jgi:hypothetical protein
MSLTLPTPPDAFEKEVPDRVASLLDGAWSRGLIKSAPDTWVVTQPHEVFTIGDDDLVNNRGLKSAHSVAWRLIVLSPDESDHDQADPVAAIDFRTSNGDVELASTNVGPFVEALFEALNSVETMGFPEQIEYKARILEIPAIQCTALWLAGDSEEANVLLPLHGMAGDWFRYPIVGEHSIDARLGEVTRAIAGRPQGTASLDELYSEIPLVQIAKRLGVGRGEVDDTVKTLVPVLVGGLQHNAQDPERASEIESEATDDAAAGLLDGDVSIDEVDQAEGRRAISRIFGGSDTSQVAAALAGAGAGSTSLIKSLLPILTPIVLAYIGKQLASPAAQQAMKNAPSGLGGLAVVLNSILGEGSTASATALGGILGEDKGNAIEDVLGGLTEQQSP